MTARPRMVVIGLDCAPPSLVFDAYLDVMPNVARLMERGVWGPLRSSAPPITVPAWTCMATGRDPGELGLYGFRNRVPGTTGLRLATGNDVRTKRVWDWIGEHGFTVAPLFVPLTWPPTPVNGHLVSGFLWPGGDAPWCFPNGLATEIETRFGPYRADVDDFRSEDLARIHRDIHALTDQHFDIAQWIWAEKSPDFMMMVDIGVDRFHHAFWRYLDPAHPRHEPGNAWEAAGRAYYARIDEHVGRLCSAVGDATDVMIVSDHGAQPMLGGVCINEWLIREGHLVLRRTPKVAGPLRHEDVDWSRTRAWAEGGYYARVFLNVEGREPAGIVPPSAIGAVVDRLRDELRAMRDDDGRLIAADVRVPFDDYRQARGFPPDLMVYFDDLRLRSIGSVGGGRIRVWDNDTGQDGCNHAWDGIFLMAGPHAPGRGRVEGATIYDVAPTILGAFGIGPGSTVKVPTKPSP